MGKKAPIILFAVTALTLSTMVTFNVLDTFVFAHEEGKVDDRSGFDFDESSTTSAATATKTISDLSSSSSQSNATNITSSLDPATHTVVEFTSSTYPVGNKNVPYHLCKIHLKKLSDFRTKVATNSAGSYGSNIRQSFGTLIKNAESEQNVHVIAAISGDFAFWKGRTGYVVRNGYTYRSSQRTTTGEDLAIFKDGTIMSYLESDYSLADLNATHNGIWQNFSFGPTLLYGGEIQVEENEEIDGQTMTQNQRTAIAFDSEGYLYFLSTEVVGNRNSSSAASFSLHTLATFFRERGCFLAYNLDGGDSSAFYYEGKEYASADRNLGDIIYVVDA